MIEEKELNHLETFSIIGTLDQLARFKSDMAKVGWKLRLHGYSGHWLGEPQFEIIAEPMKKESNE